MFSGGVTWFCESFRFVLEVNVPPSVCFVLGAY